MTFEGAPAVSLTYGEAKRFQAFCEGLIFQVVSPACDLSLSKVFSLVSQDIQFQLLWADKFLGTSAPEWSMVWHCKDGKLRSCLVHQAVLSPPRHSDK